MRTRKDALEGKALPADFRLSPTRGRSGPRAAWGGEIGGVKISERVLNMSPATGEIQVSQSNIRLDAAATSASLGSASIEIRYCVTVSNFKIAHVCKPLCDFGAILAIYRRGMRYSSRNTMTLSSSFTF